MNNKQKAILGKLLRCYLRTFPPISMNGNGFMGNLKRGLLIIPINIISKGNKKAIEETLSEWR